MRENIEKYIELIIGSILLSLGIYLFVTPNGINFGGAIGIAHIFFTPYRHFGGRSE